MLNLNTRLARIKKALAAQAKETTRPELPPEVQAWVAECKESARAQGVSAAAVAAAELGISSGDLKDLLRGMI